ncbi:hypothetical protein ABKN59_006093 [Abortiporus biennis]
MTSQSYGKDLPDQVDILSSLTDAQIDIIGDVRELFRERAALEREYATKLQLLAKKTAEKMSRKMAAIVVGSEPSKSWDENTIKQSTLDKAFSQLMSSLVDTAQDHINLSEALGLQVVDALKATEKRHEEAKKRQMQYFQKLLSERDKFYSERLKTKEKYDNECNEVESYRLKQERSTDDKHAERVAKQFEQQQADMYNGKNVYIISTAVANKVKEKFYVEDLPVLEDQFQELQTQLLTRFTKIVTHAQALQGRHLESLKSRVSVAETAFSECNPSQDQQLFIDHNIRPYTAPADWVFEPCTTHYDHGEMVIEPSPKIYLQNRLAKCRQKLEELLPTMEAKRKEVNQLAKLVEAYSKDTSLGKVDDVSDNYLEAQHQLAFYANSQCVLTAEIETISNALQGDEGGQAPHSFKNSSFTIPTQCNYCKSNIWGLSKQGKTCKACGISVHPKCELKVAADCPGTRGVRKSVALDSMSRSQSTLSRTGSQASSLKSTLMTPTPSSFARTDLSSSSIEESYPTARVLFDFSPTSPFEINISEGDTVQILEPDDGSGWIKISNPSGGKGLVPASYIEHDHNTEAKSSSTEKARASGKYVRALYDYLAQGVDELTLQDGDLIQLTEGPNGGQNYGDGWWEGVDGNGRKGIFPSNYVQLVA